MDTQTLDPRLTVDTVLKNWPKTYQVFRNRNTGCIGCYLQRFCSIQEVAETYEVPPQDFINDLEKCIKENYLNQRSIS